MNDLIQAKLVYDGGDVVKVPECMGTPRADQMQGTPAEQLCELAGRVCYDSLGKGRPSFSKPDDVFGGTLEGYHDHILKVGHGSVLEHFNFTIELCSDEQDKFPRASDLAFQMLNRPGCFTWMPCAEVARITVNLRAALEFDQFNLPDGCAPAPTLGAMLKTAGSLRAPNIIKGIVPRHGWLLSEPQIDEERWVTLFISGSRGLSHELVRHGDFTAISQRSTRFVDESESEWVDHPLAMAYCDARPDRHTNPDVYAETPVIPVAREQYSSCVSVLEPWLVSRGVDRISARKQARGAARGYLGNALYTELIFSASVAQWKRILRQRASVFADAEIREMACKALVELKSSRYGECFANWELRESPDGIGQVAVEVLA